MTVVSAAAAGSGLDGIFLAAYNIAEQNLHLMAAQTVPSPADQLTGQGVGDGALD